VFDEAETEYSLTMTEHPTGADIGTATGDADRYEDLTRAVRDLVQVMKQGDLDRLEVTSGNLHILLCAKSSVPVTQSPVGATMVAPTPAADASIDDIEDASTHVISSPMVGTFYEAPSPGEPPYVRPGDTVEVGQTVAIVEAMKIMNEIVADRPGIIEDVLVANGETVEYGHPLFKMRLNQ
jgi:acetyl-CoA carboxylase biotin carboxyl carrier protein